VQNTFLYEVLKEDVFIKQQAMLIQNFRRSSSKMAKQMTNSIITVWRETLCAGLSIFTQKGTASTQQLQREISKYWQQTFKSSRKSQVSKNKERSVVRENFISMDADRLLIPGYCYLESTTTPSGSADRLTSGTWDFRDASEPVIFISFVLFSTFLTSLANSMMESSSWPGEETCNNHS
jgi:hypothetical protein